MDVGYYGEDLVGKLCRGTCEDQQSPNDGMMVGHLPGSAPGQSAPIRAA
jgi:hypothetical protein